MTDAAPDRRAEACGNAVDAPMHLLCIQIVHCVPTTFRLTSNTRRVDETSCAFPRPSGRKPLGVATSTDS